MAFASALRIRWILRATPEAAHEAKKWNLSSTRENGEVGRGYPDVDRGE